MQQNEKFHSHKRKSLYLFQSDYIQLQLEVSSLASWRYLVQAVPSKKKKKVENFRKKIGKENEMEISGKEEKRKKEGEGKEIGGKEEKKKKWMERVCA